MKLGDHRHAPFAYPQKRDQVPVLQESGWVQGQSRRVGKNSAPPQELDLWTVQTVASRYTKYAIPVHNNNNNNNK